MTAALGRFPHIAIHHQLDRALIERRAPGILTFTDGFAFDQGKLSWRRKNCVLFEYELCTQSIQLLTPAERRVIFPAVEQRMAGDRRWRRHPRAISTKT
ncbi:hypothetical protein CO659_03065 [Rhizobium sp. S9]|nr:hypothetical protein CO659_03065 [Rhizobium sp. S9]